MIALAELFDRVTRAVVSLLAACALAVIFCIGAGITLALGIVFAVIILAIISVLWARNLLFGAPAK